MHLKIEKLMYGGDGVGFIDGMPVFVPMTVPGDEVKCEITEKKKGYLRARAVNFVAVSSNRITPKCEYFGRCGGCQWQNIDYSAQILWKQLILEEQLQRIGKLKRPNVLPTIPSPRIWNYRGRVKFHTDKNGRRGFYAVGSHDLVEIKECLIMDKEANGEHNYFTQVNSLQNENLKKMIAGLARSLGSKKALELYCGNGNLTFSVSDLVESIDAFDSDKRAIAEAIKVSKRTNRQNIRFIAASAASALEKSAKKGGDYDTLLIDPPRDGCKKLPKFVSKIGFRNIVYVSCDPATLARDIKELVSKGYELKFSQPIDMFPQTFHIESVSVLSG